MRESSKENTLQTTIIIILVLGTLASSVLSIILGVLLISLVNHAPQNTHFFEARNPQHVNMKQIHVGDMLAVTATKCNLVAEPIATHVDTYYVREQPSNKIVIGSPGDATFPPGCITKTFQHDFSKYPEVDAGTWHIEGRNTSTFGGRTEITPWYSESFEVLP